MRLLSGASVCAAGCLELVHSGLSGRCAGGAAEACAPPVVGGLNPTKSLGTCLLPPAGGSAPSAAVAQ